MQNKVLAFCVACMISCAIPAQAWQWGGWHFGWGGTTAVQYTDITTSVSVSPTSWSFGNVSTGGSKTKVFTFTSTGLGVWEQAVLTVTGTGFSETSRTCGSNPFDLASMASCTETVSFTPSTAGSFTGYLNYSAPNFPRQQVALSGTGVGAGGGSPSYTDSFTYSDGALPTVSGGLWAIPSYATSVSVVSGYVQGSTDTSQNIAYYTGWSGADQCATVTIVSVVSGLTGPAVRINSSTDTLYWLSANNFSIKKRVASTETSLTSDISATTGDILKLCANGTTLTSYKNGTLISTVTDSDISTGYSGFRETFTSNHLDDFILGL